MKPSLEKVPGDFVILRFPVGTAPPESAWQSFFCSVSQSSDELSVVCEARYSPAGAHKAEKGWAVFRVSGELDFSLTGLLASIANPLAQNQVGLLAISTFDTDYILVKSEKMNAAKSVLQKAGFSWADEL